MKICFITSECAPFSASGGLGDVMGALPAEISKLLPKAEVSVISPCYKQTIAKYKDKMKKVKDITFRLAWRETGASVYMIEMCGVSYFFIENQYYFDREMLYGNFDDGERFAFFSLAAIEYMKQSENIADIIHANDWQCALAVIYLKTVYKNDSDFSRVRTLYTIHNIEYQGKFDLRTLGDVFALDQKYRKIVEYRGCINLMKGALVVSDYISTVSPNYKNELRYDFFAFGLSEIINSVFYKIAGVINGIDYNLFSPQSEEVPFAYNISNASEGKRKNKLALQKELGLPICASAPLIIMVTRLTATKGIDLLLHILEELLSEDVQIAVLGSGDFEYERAMLNISSKHENFISVIDFDRSLAKRMYAAGDFFLMPSKSEPCGLAQMIACSYGAVPIVRSVGGLYDTITHYTEPQGNGLRFDNYNAHELLFCIKEALSLYERADEYKRVQMNAMKSSFDWKNSALKYIEIYDNLLKW